MEIILIAMTGAVILAYLVSVLTTPVCVSEHGRFKRHLLARRRAGSGRKALRPK
jgi:hypothetical protein